MDFERIKKYISLMDKENLSELEVENGEFSVFLKKESGKSDESNNFREEPVPEGKELELENDMVEVTSPMVGIVHLSDLKVESEVKKGDLLCTIEAMRVKNEIKSSYEGIILDIYVENNTPVEYGQKMFLIKKITS